MTHGTLTGYKHHRCRCQPCLDAGRSYDRSLRVNAGDRRTWTPEETEARRSCLICKTPFTDHPLVACWRAV